MAEITQTLSFEAGNAISTINSLDKSLKGLNTRLRAFNKITAESNAARVSAGFTEVGTSAAQAGREVDKATNRTKQFGKDGGDAVQKVTFAWRGLGKALLARTLVQAITRVTGAIRESADAAEDFEIAAARISNIAQGPGSGIDALTASLANLSVELGRPQAEVAEAAFEALQNDLGSTTETMDLLAGAANDLALVTGGTLTQAVNSLSSVLKAYDLDVTQADEITDQFFAAIDKGRITLAELENSLGKITPLAAKLDIGFNEVAAAMAAITQSGTSASVANTQLRSIFQKLIKPTEELQGAFTALGAQDFNQLIEQTGGLQQALTAIANELGGDQAIATAFGRLRGQLGVFNLLANEGKIFTSTLEAVNNSAGRAAEAADKIDGTAARESQKAWAQFDETLRQVGETILVIQTAFIKAFNTIIPNADLLDSALVAVAAAAALIGSVGIVTGIQAAAAAMTALGVSTTFALGPISLLAGALAVGIIAYDAFTTSVGESLAQLERDQAEGFKKIGEESKTALEQSNKEVQNILDQRSDAAQEYINELSATFDKEAKVFRTASRIANAALSGSIEDFAGGMDAIFDRIEGKVKNFQKRLEKSQDKVSDAARDLADFDFEVSQKGLSKVQKFSNELSRAKDESRDLKKELKLAAVDPKAAKNAAEIADRLIESGKKLRQEAGEFENVVRRREGEEEGQRLQRQGLEARLKLAQGEESALQKQLNTSVLLLGASESQLKAQEAITEEIGKQLQLKRELLSETDPGGALKSDAERAKDAAQVPEVDAEIKRLSALVNTEVLKAFGELKNAQALAKNIEQAFKIAKVEFANVRQAVQAKLSEAPFQVSIDEVRNAQTTGDAQINERLAAAGEPAGQNIVKAAELTRKELALVVEEMNNALQKGIDFQKQIALAQTGARTALSNVTDILGGRTGSFGRLEDEVIDIIEKIDQANIKIVDPETTKQDVELIKTDLDGLLTKLQESEQKASIADPIKKSIDLSIEAATLLEQKLQLKQVDPNVLNNLKLILQESSVKAEAIEQGLNNSSTAAGNANSNVGTLNQTLTGTVGAIDSATQAMVRLGNAASDTLAKANAAASAAAQFAFTGGKVNYRAAGGTLTRGQDKQLTALSDGEFVVNARAASNFTPQLQAMNAGQSPQFRDKGGSVTNIGDITVNMSPDSSSNPQVGRSIASELRRELRRQTSTLQ